MSTGPDEGRRGPRYVGEASRRWPEGRPLCGAKKRRDEGFCVWTAGQGTDHLGFGLCERHGGNLPAHKIHAQRLQATELAARYSVPREVHPLTGLMEQYHRYAGQVAYLEQRVNDLDPEALFWGVAEEVDRRNPDGDDGERLRTGSAAEFEVKRRAGVNAVLEQFDRVQREYAKLGVDIVKIGLESSLAAANRNTGAQLGALVQSLLADVAAKAAEACGADAAELVRLFQPLAVARVAEFAGAPVIEGSVAA